MKPTIIIRLIETPGGLRRFPGRKPEQPWRYLVSDAGNHEPFERPTERYSEERGALSAIEQVHGPDAVVILRREGHPDTVLRQPPSRRIELTDAEAAQFVTAVQNSDLVGAVAHHPRVLGRIVEMLNDVLTQHEDHVHVAVTESGDQS